ncbi:hypothetical protein ACFSKU_10180 [Pontibacter silvestris]|uniref:Lipoprotein n=1 Tax=Pontibacter silvestris TaxID=2305183 RepID=A0ABW4WYH4_9BACT|nr:hypothetical protein [Pontibacter silvestris]MCC9136794.1 hypothetical protein [Pontibacter silvestris]
MKYLYCLFGLLLLSACSSDTISTDSPLEAEGTDSLQAVQEEPQHKGNRQTTDTTDVKAAFKKFFATLQASDTVRLNELIHPGEGVWVIEQPGAVPQMTHLQDITQFKRHFKSRSFFTVADEIQQCILQEENWPTFDCADMDGCNSGYSKDGCFIFDPTKFQQSGYWNYAGLSDKQVQRVKSTLPLLQKSVLHTRTSFEFHFGVVDGHWRLLFAKLIYPCSA